MPGQRSPDGLTELLNRIEETPKALLADHPALVHALFLGLALSSEIAVTITESNGSATAGP